MNSLYWQLKKEKQSIKQQKEEKQNVKIISNDVC